MKSNRVSEVAGRKKGAEQGRKKERGETNLGKKKNIKRLSGALWLLASKKTERRREVEGEMMK